MNNFWGALASLLIAIVAILQQWNASRGAKRGAAMQQTLTTHNETATTKLDNITDITNGKLTDATQKVVDLSAENAALKAQLATQKGGTP